MTLEDFFLSDYERLRERVKELETELELAKPSRYGIADLGRAQDMVKVSVASTYCIKDVVKTAAEAHEKLAMTNEGLLEWAKRCGRSYERCISVERKTLPFTVRVTDLTSTADYATDGCSCYERIGFMEEEMVDNLGAWCLPEFEPELERAAVSELRERIMSIAEKYEAVE